MFEELNHRRKLVDPAVLAASEGVWYRAMMRSQAAVDDGTSSWV